MPIPDAAAAVIARIPSIQWDEPVEVDWSTKRLHACRICIAAYGLTYKSAWQWETETEARDHIREHFDDHQGKVFRSDRP